MSDNKQPGSGKIIRTSSGSTRLTAGSAKNGEKADPAAGSGNSAGSGSSGNSGKSSDKTRVVAPPAPKASPKPNRAPSAGQSSGGSAAAGQSPSGPAAGGSAPSSQATGSQKASSGSGPATSAMGSAANTIRASSGSVKMGVKNMVDSGKGNKKKKGPRTVRLTVSAVDPWSVMKMSFLMSVAIGIATIVAFVVLWVVLQATGVMSGLESTISEVAGAESAEKIVGIFGFGRVVAAGFIIAVINIVLMTALSTLAAFIYNIGSLIAGGFHLTLTDD
ncbi:Transmembrane protein of unknown function (DUF3566) [Brevibacterium aurantiacum]|uniref:DUF3566 domain-containing protein n=1 Tax=Brevibacterium aurantiacum TaxID=273384 RepID=A0A2H1JL17_BREAU|nr:DUF3566 domain-containing protein [Brevibacterium aurantiacum]SMX88133.1 Transmembrane protein of unknown function (DUF3566) [Brevibacterium aurantiacum]